MIKKLRRKFILLSMLSVFAILFIAMAAINISNYVVVENDATTVLNEVIRQGTKEQAPGDPNKEHKEPVELRQQHYFVVSFNSDGSVKEINNKQMFMLSKEECQELAFREFVYIFYFLKIQFL